MARDSLYIRLEPDDYDRFERLAKRRGLTITSWARMVIFDEGDRAARADRAEEQARGDLGRTAPPDSPGSAPGRPIRP